MKLVIGRTSASRPKTLEQSTKSLFLNMKFSGRVIHVLNEDVVEKGLSQELLYWAHSSHRFDKIFVNDPPTCQSEGIRRMLKCAIDIGAEYYFNFEDDWIFDQPVNIDKIIELMENNPGINQIAFHKRIPVDRTDFKKWELRVDGVNLITNIHWTVIPSIWRVSYAKRFVDVKIMPTNNASGIFNKVLKRKNQPAHWVIGNVGSYYLGKIGDPGSKYVTHIGDDISRRLNE